jgi:hypothetical protein
VDIKDILKADRTDRLIGRFDIKTQALRPHKRLHVLLYQLADLHIDLSMYKTRKARLPPEFKRARHFCGISESTSVNRFISLL